MVLGGLISLVLFSVYVYDMPSPSHHVELAFYADETAIISTSNKSTLPVSYPASYFNDLQRWFSWILIAFNVSKSTATIFARAGRRFIQPRPVTLFGNQSNGCKQIVMGVTLDTGLIWSSQIDQVRKRTTQRMGMLAPSWIGRVIYPWGTQSCYISSSCGPWWNICAPRGGTLPAPMFVGYRFKIQVSSPRYWCPLVHK